jgi:hypothetical protein
MFNIQVTTELVHDGICADVGGNALHKAIDAGFISEFRSNGSNPILVLNIGKANFQGGKNQSKRHPPITLIDVYHKIRNTFWLARGIRQQD